MAKILIAGYPYVRENYFSIFRYYPKKDELLFLLPKIWKVKRGKVIFYPPKEDNVIKAKAFFSHSNYPLIGGAFKGLMPIFPLILFKLRKKIDLVYSCSEPVLLTTLYYSFFTKILGKKHIFFSWENIPYWEKFSGFNWFFKKIILRLNLAFSDGIICGNHKGAEIYKKLTRKPIVVIPMSGANEDFFQREEKHSKEFKGIDFTGKIVFSFAGAIDLRKGIYLIVGAFNAVRKNIPNTHLIIAGSGEKDKLLDKIILESGLKEYITRIPWVDSQTLKDLFSVTDVFLYPSISYKGWEEQFGYSMVEASLMEIPIISTRSGSIEEVVIDGQTGILVEPDNITELTQAIIRLAKDKNLRKSMGYAGRGHIIKNFSHHVIARKFCDFFEFIGKE